MSDSDIVKEGWLLKRGEYHVMFKLLLTFSKSVFLRFAPNDAVDFLYWLIKIKERSG